MKRALFIALVLLTGSAWSADVTLPDYERVELDNGTILLLSEKHDVPLVGMRAVVRGGSATDPKGRSGLADLLATVIQKGAGKRDAAEFAEAVAGVGGSLSASANLETISVSAEFLSRDVELMIELVADMLMRPTLSEEEFEKERDRGIALIRAAKGSDPSGLMPAYANAFIFGNHAYGNPPGGSEETLAELSHEDIKQYYGDFFGGDRLIIAVVGDYDLEAMKAKLTSVFGGWEPAAAKSPVLAAPALIAAPRVLLVDKPGATQTYFWIGNIGVAVDYPRRAEVDLANTVFGGRFTSMLMTALRVDGGLTYSARSAVERYAETGTVTIRSFTETSTTIDAIDLAISTLDRLHIKGLNDELITSARNYIMGQFPPTLETASSLARMLAFLEQNGLDRRYVDEYGAALREATPVTISNTIAEVYPTADDLVFVLIGDAAAIRDDVAKYGPVTELSITAPRFRPQSPK
jgi:predicted Zn-dependent peptidase